MPQRARTCCSGCVDTDSGRLILNELAVTHAIPYIDCGAGIVAPGGSIQAAGGQVIVWMLGRPCLLCCGEIDRAIAAEELESPEQRAFRRREGYVAGADVPEPAVMSLNGTIGSLAVTEFLALVTGFRPANHYTCYDMVEQRVGPRKVTRDARCFTCSIEGSGDEAGPVALQQARTAARCACNCCIGLVPSSGSSTQDGPGMINRASTLPAPPRSGSGPVHSHPAAVEEPIHLLNSGKRCLVPHVWLQCDDSTRPLSSV